MQSTHFPRETKTLEIWSSINSLWRISYKCHCIRYVTGNLLDEHNYHHRDLLPSIESDPSADGKRQGKRVMATSKHHRIIAKCLLARREFLEVASKRSIPFSPCHSFIARCEIRLNPYKVTGSALARVSFHSRCGASTLVASSPLYDTLYRRQISCYGLLSGKGIFIFIIAELTIKKLVNFCRDG